jgi:hypothetical protein
MVVPWSPREGNVLFAGYKICTSVEGTWLLLTNIRLSQTFQWCRIARQRATLYTPFLIAL